MNAELARTEPAVQTMSHPNHYVLRAELKRMVARGEVEQMSLVRVDHAGRGSVAIRRLRAPRPRWIRPLVITASVGVGVTVFVLVAYVVLSTLAAMLTTIIGGALVLLGMLGLARAASAGHRSHKGKGWHWTDC